MNRLQKIIVSVTGIFLVLLILVGLTYAYFLTRINGNRNDKSISVSTANLELKYDDIEQVLISEENVEPGKTWTKKFSATNTGSKKVESYGVALENVINTLERTEDLVYTLNCTSSLGTTCNKVEDEQEFPTIGKILITNSIESKEVQSYELTITYKDQNIDQSIDMNKQFSGKINIVNPSTFNPYVGSMLNSVIIGSAKNASEESNVTRTTFGTSEIPTTYKTTETERLLNSAPDDYGTSYYFRGNVLDNNVTFAGKNWKIVRINGDGSVRLVLDGSAGESEFNTNYDNNAYVGYMYGLTGQTSTNTNQCVKLNSDGTAAEVDTTNKTEETCVAAGNKWAPTAYDATHTNVVSSTIKTNLEAWYKTNIVDTNNTGYIAENIFCNDKSLESGTGIGQDDASYNGKYSASLECAKGANNDYSRFTSKNNTSNTTIKGVKVNKDLTYPVGLLTYTEVKYAGLNLNNTYYLYNINTPSWWLSSPYNSNGSYVREWYVNGSGGNFSSYYVHGTVAFRPSLSLKANVLINGGDGTGSNPYTIKLS